MKFAFVVHPIEPKDISRQIPIARFMPDSYIEKMLLKKAPKMVSHITGIRAKNGSETEGWFVGLPMTPNLMMNVCPVERSYELITRCAQIAEELGAEIIGLGAFSSVVGDGGITVAERSNISVTTGNSYTVATAIQGALRACHDVGIEPSSSVLAVVGATGSIGKTCARILAPQFERTLVIGRDLERTQTIADELPRARASVDTNDLLQADVLISVSSAGEAIVLPHHLAPGAVVVDVSRPRDVSVRVAKERNDVLVIEGGMVSVPGDVEFNFNFGFPRGTAYACMCETMMLALEGRRENFTLGKEVSVEQATEMMAMSERLGFNLAGFRSFETVVSQAAIERAKKARATKSVLVPLNVS